MELCPYCNNKLQKRLTTQELTKLNKFKMKQTTYLTTSFWCETCGIEIYHNSNSFSNYEEAKKVIKKLPWVPIDIEHACIENSLKELEETNPGFLESITIKTPR
jgi:hypothetical protein